MGRSLEDRSAANPTRAMPARNPEKHSQKRPASKSIYLGSAGLPRGPGRVPAACPGPEPVPDYATTSAMSRGKSDKSRTPDGGDQKVNLRELAEHLGLSVATVSLVMNRSPAA